MENELILEYVPTDNLVFYARNPVKNDGVVDQMVASIREFGFRLPILAKRDGTVVDGHLRLKAAKQLGFTEVPVVYSDGMSDAQIKAFRLMTRNSAKWANWDEELLRLEIADLKSMDFDLKFTGFDDKELTNFINGIEDDKDEIDDSDEDEIPEAPKDIVCQQGDIWVLGNHRLACGDSGDFNIIEKLMNGERADVCFTSPPYSTQRTYDTSVVDIKKSTYDEMMENVFRNLDTVMKDDGQVFVNLGIFYEGGEWSTYWYKFVEMMRNTLNWRRFGLYIWDKGPGMPGLSNGRFSSCWEFIFHFNRKSREPNKIVECSTAGQSTHYNIRSKEGEVIGRKDQKVVQDMKIPDSVVRIQFRGGGARDKLTQEHPAVFAVDLPAHFIESYTESGDVVFECFSGSGTTIMAAEKTGRKCYAIDISPRYCDIALLRWQERTGHDAYLASTQETYLEVKDRLYP